MTGGTDDADAATASKLRGSGGNVAIVRQLKLVLDVTTGVGIGFVQR